MSNHQDEDGFSFLELDLYKLHAEWVNQPRLYHRYARELADARGEVDEAKAKLELVEAELDRDIRADPVAFEVVKISEGAISNRIKLTPEYQAAIKAYNAKRHRAGVLQAVVDTLEQRKKALENLVLLWSRDYFSTPKEPEEVRGKPRTPDTIKPLRKGPTRA